MKQYILLDENDPDYCQLITTQSKSLLLLEAKLRGLQVTTYTGKKSKYSDYYVGGGWNDIGVGYVHALKKLPDGRYPISKGLEIDLKNKLTTCSD